MSRDQVDEDVDQTRCNVMPHARQDDQACATDGRCGGVTATGRHHQIPVAMDDQRGAPHAAQLGRPITGIDDCPDLPRGADVVAQATTALPGLFCILPVPRLAPLQARADHSQEVDVISSSLPLITWRPTDQLQYRLERRLADLQ